MVPIQEDPTLAAGRRDTQGEPANAPVKVFEPRRTRLQAFDQSGGQVLAGHLETVLLRG